MPSHPFTSPKKGLFFVLLLTFCFNFDFLFYFILLSESPEVLRGRQ